MDIESDIRCPHCEYELTGLTDNRCPECGERFFIVKREQAVRQHGILDTDVSTFIGPLLGVIFCVFLSVESSLGALVGAAVLAAAVAYWTRCRDEVWKNERLRILLHAPNFAVVCFFELVLYWNTWTPVHVAVILLLGLAVGVFKRLPHVTAFILKVCAFALCAQAVHFWAVAMRLKGAGFVCTDFDWAVYPGGEQMARAAMSVQGAMWFSAALIVIAVSLVLIAFLLRKRGGGQ
ncbi:MAG: hypothetical protein U0640_13185 [Phycisphaerales bacterium]